MNALIRFNASPCFMPRPTVARYAKPITASPVAVNVKEDETAFLVAVAAPGLAKTDFSVNVANGVLTISYRPDTTATPSGETFTRREFALTPFERSFKLPATVNVDEISANYTNGILTVTLPKMPKVEPVVKTIAIA